jgi:SOS-response transcriptional repressor LexA
MLPKVQPLRPLTARQASVLEYVRTYTVKNGYPPTLREIGKNFGIRSTNGVNDHLKALERKGYLIRFDMLSRGMRIVGEMAPSGRIAEDAREMLREENFALRELLRRVLLAAENLPRLNPTMAVALGDVRSVLGRKP